jgi:magnesium chelatase family protein
MPRPAAEALEGHAESSSAVIRAAVLEARERQAHRLAGSGLTTNAELTPRLVRELVRADAGAIRLLRLSYAERRLSARGHGRILRVARTIADLDGCPRVGAEHVGAALNLRNERVLEGAVAA